jgi:uncharacterized protein (DUF2252 family)
MSDRHLLERIEAFNRGRRVDSLKIKYRDIGSNPFAFLRGTCHLFYEDMPKDSFLQLAPLVWVCGDLHLENFGTYKGDDREVYFGINDFDEATLAPLTYDLVRLLTSIYLATGHIELSAAESKEIVSECLRTYLETLATEEVEELTEDNASGEIRKLFKELKGRDRSKFLEKRVETREGERKLQIIPEKTMPIEDNTLKEKIIAVIDELRQYMEEPDFFIVRDIVFRIAGLGSLGIERYLALVEGKGKNQEYLLDIKQQRTAAIEQFATLPNPQQFDNPAERILTARAYCQPHPPALMANVEIDSQNFILRELQPSEDKVKWQEAFRDEDDRRQFCRSLAKVAAWEHANSAANQGSDNLETIAAFANRGEYFDDILAYSREYATQVRQDWREYQNLVFFYNNSVGAGLREKI